MLITINTTTGSFIGFNHLNASAVNHDKIEDYLEDENESWPIWVKQVTCLSHLALAFNSSTNFFIYYIKRRSLLAGKVVNQQIKLPYRNVDLRVEYSVKAC